MPRSILLRALFLILCLGITPTPRATAITPLPMEPLLVRVVPDDAILCLNYSGFTAPVESGTNRTERLLAEPEVQRFLHDTDRLIQSLLEKIPESNSDGPNREQAQLMYRWAKRLLHCPWTIYLGNIQPSPDGGPPQFEAAWLVKLDDQVDAGLEFMQQILGIDTSELQPQTVAGVSCKRWQPEADAPPIFFGSRGKFLLMTVGDDSMANMMARSQGEPPTWLSELADSKTVPRKLVLARYDMSRTNQLIEQEAPPEVRQMWTACGMPAVSSIQILKGLDDQGIVIHGSITASSLTGLFSLLDEEPLTKEDLRMIPPDALRAFAWRFSPSKVMPLIESLVAAAVDEEAAGEMKAGLQQFAATTGLRVEEDILRPLGDSGCLFQTPGGFVGIPNATLAISLRDAAKFETTHARLLELLEASLSQVPDDGPQVKLATTKMGDQTVHYASGMPFSPAWCVTKTHLVVSISTMSLQGFLSRDADSPSLADEPAVAAHLSSGQGPLSISYLDTPQVLQGTYQALPMLMGMASAQLQQAGIELSPTLLPKWEDIRDHLTPSVAVVRRTRTGVEYYSQCSLPGSSLTSGTSPVLVAMLLPAVQAARTAARRTGSMNNLRQIGLGILNYESARREFPSPALPTKDGQPGLSWRVAILPYLEEQELYERFHLDEPWDSPHNKSLLKEMPSVYASPISGLEDGMTTYLAVVGNDGALGDPGATQSTRIREIEDGTSKTIMLLEVNDDRGVPWTKPDDHAWDRENPLAGLDDTYAGNVFLALFGDCHIESLPLTIPAERLRAMFTKSGGEAIPAER